MNFWSQGLGKRELVMNLERSRVTRLEDCILLTGVVDSPAPWEYEVKVHREDWNAILKTASSAETGGFLARSFSFGCLIQMGVTLTKFVMLLAFYRTAKVLGLSRKPEVPARRSPEPSRERQPA